MEELENMFKFLTYWLIYKVLFNIYFSISFVLKQTINVYYKDNKDNKYVLKANNLCGVEEIFNQLICDFFIENRNMQIIRIYTKAVFTVNAYRMKELNAGKTNVDNPYLFTQHTKYNDSGRYYLL